MISVAEKWTLKKGRVDLQYQIGDIFVYEALQIQMAFFQQILPPQYYCILAGYFWEGICASIWNLAKEKRLVSIVNAKAVQGEMKIQAKQLGTFFVCK